jgi:GrpB-like predicted nucleotidyltransferase (UPF0157 family)
MSPLIAILVATRSSRYSCRLARSPYNQDVPADEERLRKVIVGELRPLAGKIQIVAYSPDWPRLFEHEAVRIRSALGATALSIEHTGSTSVPGLAAKPIIDMTLQVPDSANEEAYVPRLESAGYVLRVREPDWHQHRMFLGPDTPAHLHVFSAGCSEVNRLLLFRNWLRANPEDRELYAKSKRTLAEKDWKYMQNYADAKTAVIEQIIARATNLSR